MLHDDVFLVGHAKLCHVQTASHSVQKPAWLGTAVPFRALYTCREHGRTSSTSFCHSLATTSIHPSCALRSYGRPAFAYAGPFVWNSLQIIYGLTIDNSQLQALVEDISVWVDGTCSALETFIVVIMSYRSLLFALLYFILAGEAKKKKKKIEPGYNLKLTPTIRLAGRLTTA